MKCMTLESSLATKTYKCGWCGLDCKCNEFPWKINGFIPDKCETLIRNQMPALIPFRAVRNVSRS